MALRTEAKRTLDRAESILFVFGAARSGTTFLNKVLDEWFDFGMGPEGTFVGRFSRQLGRYGDLAVPENLDLLIQDVANCEMLEIARNKYSEKKRFDVTPELIREKVREATFAGVVHAVFLCMAQLQGRSRLGNKNPGYWKDLDLLLEMFPGQSKFLCIVRDGRDVALSKQKISWGQKSVYANAKRWAQSIKATERFRTRVSPERLMIIRYEDFLETPNRTVRDLEQFLNVSLEEKDRLKLIESIEKSPMRENFGKWRSQMSLSDRRVFEAIAGEPLAALGYECSMKCPKIYLYEHAWHNLLEGLRLLRLNLGRG